MAECDVLLFICDNICLILKPKYQLADLYMLPAQWLSGLSSCAEILRTLEIYIFVIFVSLNLLTT